MSSLPHEPTPFGAYVLTQQIATGGVAEVWAARPARAASAPADLVVKRLHPRLRGQALFAELFAAEARITRLVAHPGIVRVVDAGRVRGTPFVAMERIDGRDLASIYRALPPGMRLPTDVALTLALDMCRALAAAHGFRDERGRARPLVHGDLSPSNVLVRRDGGVTLVDFGAAYVAGGRGQLVVGNRGYLAPELLDGARRDPRADVFSAGVMLHELLVGRHLFAVDNERETLRRLSEQPVTAPSQSNPSVSRALDEVVLRALARDPAARFGSAGELADALERLLTPARATRHRVMQAVLPLFGGARPTDAAAPLPTDAAWTGTTGTVAMRRRAARKRTAAPRPQRRGGGLVLCLVAAVATFAALHTSAPTVSARRWVGAGIDALVALASPVAGAGSRPLVSDREGGAPAAPAAAATAANR